MSDLSYSISALQGLGNQLIAIADVMNGVSPQARYSDADIGHPKVAAALDHFADNWDDKRELLTRSLKAVGGMAQQSAEVFREADEKLAAEVKKIMKDSS